MASEKIDLEKFLNEQGWCESLTFKEIKLLIDYTELVSFKNKAIVAEIGEVGNAIFIILEGEVALFGDGNKPNEVGRIKKGEIMGEMSFFDRRPRSVMLQAMGSTQLLKMTRTMYSRLRIEHPYIAVNVLEHAIVSLDHLFRRASKDVTTFANYLYSPGRK